VFPWECGESGNRQFSATPPHEFFRDISERPTGILPGTAQVIRELV
jgi:hypothetical protein